MFAFRKVFCVYVGGWNPSFVLSMTISQLKQLLIDRLTGSFNINLYLLKPIHILFFYFISHLSKMNEFHHVKRQNKKKICDIFANFCLKRHLFVTRHNSQVTIVVRFLLCPRHIAKERMESAGMCILPTNTHTHNNNTHKTGCYF